MYGSMREWSQFGRQDPFTGLWLNSTPCPACWRALKKGGRHRSHQCQGDTVNATTCFVCDCECRRMSTAFLKAFEEQRMSIYV